MAALPRAGLFDRLVLHGPGDPGYAGKNKHRKSKKISGSAAETAGDEVFEPFSPGSIGTAITDLRPVGKVKIENRTVVAETDGEYYDKGTQVVVLRINGVKVVVSAREE